MLAKKLITNSSPGMILRQIPPTPGTDNASRGRRWPAPSTGENGVPKQPKKAAFQAVAADGEVRPLQNSVIFAISLLMRRRESLSAIGIPVLILPRTAGSLRT
jgi:hypothetical protein